MPAAPPDIRNWRRRPAWQASQFHAGMSQQPEIAVGILGQNTQAFDPIAVIGVDKAVHQAQVGAVDVPTDNAVKAAAARILDACLHESLDELLGGIARALEEISQ